ncbi:Pre-mRNA-splicing factor SYF2 [Rhizoctonia solani AG-3 Rhs1AP]|uniref:Pre-mRNA-splicing factor SYF2 n=2 Tax=Rhizoctonia solani AG-3 TaxID=1086053 RepID=A0A074RPR3_9AGAM|nr:Pre-mRNA-splicing factor SYF2 [Rhizoctonia solani AG-3 Rhs1AP]KEP49056.1 Pre-mRNA-splicing factor SYF2 [Rhizoctonia solani 123E]
MSDNSHSLNDLSTATRAESGGSDSGREDATDSGANTPMTESSAGGKMTIEERAARMEALRAKMRETTAANRKDVIAEHDKAKFSVKAAARLEKQRRLAETLRESMDAEERGEDIERKKNWEYSIEENDEWEKRKSRKDRRADFQFHDDAHAARRKYKKDLDLIKPDLVAYQAQKEAAMSQGSALQAFSGGSSSNAVTASELLYRDANTLLYGDNKPSEEAIDRVVGKINHDLDKRSKFSRKRTNEEEGDITYINERNRVFNKKIARFYDKYTAETRASFERGTAL